MIVRNVNGTTEVRGRPPRKGVRFLRDYGDDTYLIECSHPNDALRFGRRDSQAVCELCGAEDAVDAPRLRVEVVWTRLDGG